MRKNSFTLVELLIVIIIIGILATMAVPQYQKMVEKARISEAFTNLGAIRQALESYYLQYGKYFDSNEIGGVDYYKTFLLNDILDITIQENNFVNYHVHTLWGSSTITVPPPNNYVIHCDRKGHDRLSADYWDEIIMYQDGSTKLSFYKGLK